MKNLKTSDAKSHSEHGRKGFQELIEQLRNGIEQVDDPKAKALFETSAEVLTGLKTAFSHYEEGKEEAWK